MEHGELSARALMRTADGPFRALLAARPDATPVDFPATGIPIHAEREDAFVAAVEAFLKD